MPTPTQTTLALGRALVIVAILTVPKCLAQFNFGSLYDFDLASDVIFPAPGDEVTLSCRRTDQYRRKSSNSFLGQNDGISWELNDRPLLTTSVDNQRRCQVTKASGSGILGGSGFRQSAPARPARLPNATCSDDGETIKLTIHQWTPARVAGDVWRCLEFPFGESAKLDLQSFVPVTGVAIKQVIDDGGQYTQSRGTIVTCRTAPCRPRASIDWFVQPTEGALVRLSSSPTLREQVDTDRDELSVTTSAILFSEDDDHGKQVYCTSSNQASAGERAEQIPVRSTNITVRVKYPPSVSVFTDPSSSVIEGSDVSLHCDAEGRPTPKVTWVKVNSREDSAETGSKATLVSLSAVFDLVSVTVKDSGTYTCTAMNGLEPNASASLVLYVREAAAPPTRMPEVLHSEAEITSDEGDASSGPIAGGVIAAIAIVALVAVLVFFVLKHRRKEERFLDRLSAQRSIEYSEGQGTYATCTSLPRASLDQLPPYLELLPPTGSDLKLAHVSNPGYGSNDMIIADQTIPGSNHSANSKRPLPSTPIEHCDTEYDYIDESHVLSTQTPACHKTENTYLKLQAVRTASDGSTSAKHADYSMARPAVDGDGYEIPVKPREAQPPEAKPRNFAPSSRQRGPARAQTVHTSRPVGSQDPVRPQGTRGSHQERGNFPVLSSRSGGSTRSGPPGETRRGHPYPSDFSYDTSF